MKSVDELINYRIPPGEGGEYWTRMTYRELKELVEATQKDAFDAGRAHQMRDIADTIYQDLPLTAQSLRKHADQITQPKDAPCSKKGEM